MSVDSLVKRVMAEIKEDEACLHNLISGLHHLEIRPRSAQMPLKNALDQKGQVGAVAPKPFKEIDRLLIKVPWFPAGEGTANKPVFSTPRNPKGDKLQLDIYDAW